VNHYFRVVRLSEKKGEPAAEFCTRGYRAIG